MKDLSDHRGFRLIDPEYRAVKAMDDFFAVFGRFMHEYAYTEEAINHFMVGFAADKAKVKGAGHTIIKALGSGLRFNQTRDTLLRIMSVSEHPEPSIVETKRIMRQMNLINAFRDRMAHNPVGPSFDMEKPLTVFNLHNSKDYRRAEAISFSVTDLEDAIADLQRIAVNLPIAADEGRSNAWAESTYAAPWRYTPSTPEYVMKSPDQT